jgi:hypothetical protein
MTEAQKLDAPFFFATDEPPAAPAIVDDDICLTVTTAVPGFPGKVKTIDIILTVDMRRRSSLSFRPRSSLRAATSRADRLHSSSTAVASLMRSPGPLSQARKSRPCRSAIAATSARPSPVPEERCASSAR